MSPRPAVAFFLCILAIAASGPPASGSTVESATRGSVAYQFDGASHHDAPDRCGLASPEWSVPLAQGTDGMLAAPDDVSDVFVVDIPHDLRGKRVHVALSEPADAGSLELSAFAPGCAGSVLDLVNWPAPEPSPPAPAPGEEQYAAGLEPRHCDGDQWLFFIDRLQGLAAPAGIHVAWTDGSERTVPLYGQYGSVAIYVSEENLGILLKGAWANLPAAWDGRFELAAGPCDAVDGGAVYGEPPVAGMGFLEFTPVRAGQHVVQVTYRSPAGDLLMPVPAPVAVDLGPYPPEASDWVSDPTGTIDPHDHDGHAHEAGMLPHTHGDVGSLQPLTLDQLATAVSSPPPAPTAEDLATVSPAMPGPVMVPMSCHGCIGAIEDVADLVDYGLTAMVL